MSDTAIASQVFFALAFSLLLPLPMIIAAEGRVEMELAADSGLPVNTHQEWYRLLVDLGVSNLRIHSSPTAGEPTVKMLGSSASPIYQVHGRLTGRGELLLPGGRFTLRDSNKLGQWLVNLKTTGSSTPAAAKGPFSLSREQLAEVHAALAAPLAVTTRGQPHATVVAQARSQMKLPLVFEVAGKEAAAGQEPITEELQGLSCGTALAFLLRPAGLGLSPRVSGGGGLELVVRQAARNAEVWPVGWPPGAQKPLPKLFEGLSTNLDDVTIAETLAAIEENLQAPILYDRYALMRRGIDPVTFRITIPESKTSYSQLVTRILSKAQLKYELRVDEAGKPLLWVTTMIRAE